MQIVITGGRGQLGQELARVLCASHEVLSLDLPECDITHFAAIERIAAHQPALVMHCAAMTDVDGCARDPLAAYRANALGTHNVALACQRARAPMLYLSTNEVFDGTQTAPYLEWDAPRALNPYGASKLAGERIVQVLLDQFYIVRAAWFYSPGRENFITRVLARAKAQGALAYVDDEIGNPTYAPDLARAIAALIQTKHYGIYHLVGEGIASRYDWAAHILQRAGLRHIPITRAKLADFKRDSTPPRNGALANFIAANSLGIKLRAWQDALEEYFTNLKSGI
ncbi:MAG: dTDP-4-dehydrorhamnose reductase [Chloroflexi bacterium]|nr:dTDP-4-dehydrorhamnose reductase [Chloroflexota bacterium]